MGIKYDVLEKFIANSKEMGEIAFDAAEERFLAEKENVIDEFENDIVSEELLESKDSPETSENISNTIHGGKDGDNLFSFIGFDRGTDVISPVKEALENNWNLIKSNKGAIGRGRNRKIEYNFTSKLDTDAIEDASPLPFEDGSWVRAIEKGISGVTHYLAGVFGPYSHSGGGIQIDADLPKTYTKRPYLFTFIRRAFERLRK